MTEPPAVVASTEPPDSLPPPVDASLQFLRWTIDAERGASLSELPNNRDLTEAEEEAKRAALEVLLRYFDAALRK